MTLLYTVPLLALLLVFVSVATATSVSRQRQRMKEIDASLRATFLMKDRTIAALNDVIHSQRQQIDLLCVYAPPNVAETCRSNGVTVN